jgi:hypothetical protein
MGDMDLRARRPGDYHCEAQAVQGVWMLTWGETAGCLVVLGIFIQCGLILFVYTELKAYLEDIAATSAQARDCLDDLQGSHQAAPAIVLAEPVRPVCRRRLQPA